jgi:hypothetical protein
VQHPVPAVDVLGFEGVGGMDQSIAEPIQGLRHIVEGLDDALSIGKEVRLERLSGLVGSPYGPGRRQDIPEIGGIPLRLVGDTVLGSCGGP